MDRRITQFGATDFLRNTSRPKRTPPKTVDIRPDTAEVSSVLRTTPTEPSDRYEILSCVEDVIGEPHLGVRKSEEATRVLILKRSKNDNNKFLQTFYQLQHRNIATVIEAFSTEISLYIVLEDMTPLDKIVACPMPLINAQFIAILGQILDGLVYLNQHSFSHGNLQFSSILVDIRGIIKLISNETYPKYSTESVSKDMQAFSNITGTMTEYLEPNQLDEETNAFQKLVVESNWDPASSFKEIRNHTLLTSWWSKYEDWPTSQVAARHQVSVYTVQRCLRLSHI